MWHSWKKKKKVLEMMMKMAEPQTVPSRKAGMLLGLVRAHPAAVAVLQRCSEWVDGAAPSDGSPALGPHALTARLTHHSVQDSTDTGIPGIKVQTTLQSPPVGTSMFLPAYPLLMQVSPFWVARCCWDYGEHPASCQGKERPRDGERQCMSEKEVDEGRVGLWEP